jgi:D-lactate dehydrogenase (cytochrome)
MAADVLLTLLRHAVGDSHVLTGSDTDGYCADWRGRFAGKALAVVRPGSTDEVAAVVRLCRSHGAPIVPQGGNTGLVLGSVPDASGTAIVLSTRRLNRIRAVDPVNQTLTAEAGCLLQDVQHAASSAHRLFPLSLAAEGSCTIGGNLATNAGGTGVLRYGNTRELCLGLEVVTPDGEIWSSLRGLRKDNTGYDLRDLYIGAEGTLGIITAAVLKLHPLPAAQMTALAAMDTPDDALALLNLAQRLCGPALTGFELMSGLCVDLVERHYPKLAPRFAQPFGERYPQCVLLEVSSSESEQHANALLEKTLAQAMDEGCVRDALVATSLTQSSALWQLREHIPLAQAADGKNIKHDISLPVSRIPAFLDETDALLRAAFPGVRLVTFGHLGDGNLHYNVAAPDGVSDAAFLANQGRANRIVHDSVDRHGGSISAEHGIGVLKRDELRVYKSPVELALMRAVKQALDPANIMNPGKIL